MEQKILKEIKPKCSTCVFMSEVMLPGTPRLVKRCSVSKCEYECIAEKVHKYINSNYDCLPKAQTPKKPFLSKLFSWIK